MLFKFKILLSKLSLVESDQIVTVITAPDPIQLANRVESDRIRPIYSHQNILVCASPTKTFKIKSNLSTSFL